jgi:GNAT superfamily N-acetyltransferase
MNFEIVPAHQLSLAEQARVFTDAFTGYLAGFKEINAEAMAALLSAQGIDLCYSRFIRTKADNKSVAFGYINRTGNVSRLAGMGTVPGARRTGGAGTLLSHLLAEAKARGDDAMVLEVFEQNTPALALYRQNGFRELTRLFGWRRVNDPPKESLSKIEEISLLAALEMPSLLEYPELPWQVSRHAVAKLLSARAFHGDGAAVVIADPDVPPTRFHAFLGFDGDWTPLRNVAAALLARFPKIEFIAREIFPEPFGTEIFERLGLHREPLNQFLMRREL